MSEEYGIFGQILAGFTFVAFNRRFVGRVKTELQKLNFWRGGMRERIVRLAAGHGSEFDIAVINNILTRTGPETIAAEAWLTKHHERIAKVLGIPLAQQIDAVVYSKMGAGALRDQITQLVGENSISSERAQLLLERIDEFNHALAALPLPQ